MSPDPRPHPFDPSGDDLPEALDPTRSDAGSGVLVLAEADGPTDREWSGRAALRLARSWAGAGRRIFLADLSLDEPLLHDLLGEPNGEGISDAVLYGASVRRIARAPAGAGFYFAPAGTVVADPAEVLGHERWEALAEGFRGAGATLVLYLPTTLAGADRLLHRADEFVVLGEADGTVPEDRVRAVLVPPAAGQAAGAAAEIDEDIGSADELGLDEEAEPTDEPTPESDFDAGGGLELEAGFGEALEPEEEFAGAVEPEEDFGEALESEPAPESDEDVDWGAGLDSEGDVDWEAGLETDAPSEPEDDLAAEPVEPESGTADASEEPTDGGPDLGSLEPGAGEPFDALAAFETEPEADTPDPLVDEDDPGAESARMEPEAAPFADEEAEEAPAAGGDPAEPEVATPTEPDVTAPTEPDPAPPTEPGAAPRADEAEGRPGEGDPLFPRPGGTERTRTSRSRVPLLVLLLVVVLGGAVLAWYYGVIEVPGVPPAEEVVGVAPAEVGVAAAPAADAPLPGTPARAPQGGLPTDSPSRA